MRLVGVRACEARSQRRAVYSGSASICARIDHAHGAATSTGRNITQIARAPAPSWRAAAAAIEKALTTKRHVASESSAKPPRL